MAKPIASELRIGACRHALDPATVDAAFRSGPLALLISLPDTLARQPVGGRFVKRKNGVR